MDPGAAEFDLMAGELAAEGAPAEAVTSFENHRLVAVFHAVARGSHACEAATDDHHVVVAISIPGAAPLTGNGRPDRHRTSCHRRACRAYYAHIPDEFPAAYTVRLLSCHAVTFLRCHQCLAAVAWKHARTQESEADRPRQ
ncbi:hypothetical protein D3C81_1588610 [compost metagenome]